MVRKTNRAKLERELVKQGYTFIEGVLQPPAGSAIKPAAKTPAPKAKSKPPSENADGFPDKIIDDKGKEEPTVCRCGACQTVLSGEISPCPECGAELTW